MLELAVGAPAAEFGGAVHAGAHPERIRDEMGCGRARAMMVTARQTRSADVDLTDDAGRHLVQLLVEDVAARTHDRAADRDGRVGAAVARARLTVEQMLVSDQP